MKRHFLILGTAFIILVLGIFYPVQGAFRHNLEYEIFSDEFQVGDTFTWDYTYITNKELPESDHHENTSTVFSIEVIKPGYKIPAYLGDKSEFDPGSYFILTIDGNLGNMSDIAGDYQFFNNLIFPITYQYVNGTTRNWQDNQASIGRQFTDNGDEWVLFQEIDTSIQSTTYYHVDKSMGIVNYWFEQGNSSTGPIYDFYEEYKLRGYTVPDPNTIETQTDADGGFVDTPSIIYATLAIGFLSRKGKKRRL